VRLPEGPIRTIGVHSIDLHLHSDVNATLRITVVAEDDGGQAAS
ncbi:MAG: hypothetical protein OEW88_05950, partial [Gammaproteobacteria bacterium]|nr:hypothetical protein [Gammaproteobacteria bacterium]